jgi:hypothetical protein
MQVDCGRLWCRKAWDLLGTTLCVGTMLRLLPHLIHIPFPSLALKVLYRVKWPAPGIWEILWSLHPKHTQVKANLRLQSLHNPNPMTWCLHPKPYSHPSRRSLNFLTAFPLMHVWNWLARFLHLPPTHLSGPPSSWAVHKIVVLFVAKYGSTT